MPYEWRGLGPRKRVFSSFSLPIYFGNWRFVHRKNCDD
jgi:hypothetical protein